jgi:hypothetical protein
MESTTASRAKHRCNRRMPYAKFIQGINRRQRKADEIADVLCFVALGGLRTGEALPLDWESNAENMGKLAHPSGVEPETF